MRISKTWNLTSEGFQSSSQSIKWDLHLQLEMVLKHFKSCPNMCPWSRSPKSPANASRHQAANTACRTDERQCKWQVEDHRGDFFFWKREDQEPLGNRQRDGSTKYYWLKCRFILRSWWNAEKTKRFANCYFGNVSLEGGIRRVLKVTR